MKTLFFIILTCILAVPLMLLAIILILKIRPLDYEKERYWLRFPKSSEKEADCFLVYPTVDLGKKGNLLASVRNEKYRSLADGTLKQMEGLYDEVCDIYAPHYRQLTLMLFRMVDFHSAVPEISYMDVKRAFELYLERCDESRPLFLAGFSQGSAIIQRIFRDFADDPRVSKRLVAAYSIGWPMIEKEWDDTTNFKPAKRADDIGVIISYNSETEGVTAFDDNDLSCSINPINWKTDGSYADKDMNKGAKFYDTYGNITEEIPNFCSAYINEKTGVLKVPDVNPEEYPGKIFPDGIFHIYDYFFFYNNIKENVKTRLEAFKKL